MDFSQNFKRRTVPKETFLERFPGMIKKFFERKGEINVLSESGQGLANFNFDKESILGSGWLSVVFRAESVDGRSLAAKIFSPHKELLERESELGGNVLEELKNKFLREIKVLSGLSHENIVKFEGWGLIKITEGTKIPVLLMELLPKNLSEIFDSGPEIEPDVVLGIFEDIVKALDYLKDNGIIVLDLNPEHIGQRGNGDWVLMDFNLVFDEMSEKIQQIAKDKVYSAPEGVPTIQSEVYSLGIIAYEILSDKRIDVLDKAYSSGPFDFVFPETSKIQPEVLEVIKKACTKDPAARFSSPREFFENLKNALVIGEH